jgi:hypothetical protein
MQGFKSAGHAQRFLSIFGPFADLFGVGCHLLSAPNYRAALSRRFIEWRSIAGVPAAALPTRACRDLVRSNSANLTMSSCTRIW